MQVLFSSAYLPPVLYFALLTQAEKAVIDIHETYPKQTYRNRCYIYASNGILPLSIPVHKVNGNHTKTKNIQVDYSLPWQQVHWRAIQSAYNKSPYFLHYKDNFSALYYNQVKYLLDWNTSLLMIITKILKIQELFPEQSLNYIKDTTGFIDWRLRLSPKNTIDINKIIYFPRYIQTFEDIHGFIPNLSILDLLFNEGPSSYNYLKNIKVN